MIKKNKTIKNQKPIRLETQLVYQCPMKACGLNHWIGLNAAKTKNYKIVCDCGCVFQPKLVKGLKIAYKKKTTINKNQSAQSVVSDNADENKYETYKQGYDIDSSTQESVHSRISEELLNKSIPVLIGYGFTKTESSEILTKVYKANPTDDVVELIRLALSNLEK